MQDTMTALSKLDMVHSDIAMVRIEK